MAIMEREEFLENLDADGIEEEDLESFEGKAPEKPEFPFLMFALGVTKDIIDALDGVGIIGAIANVFTATILFFYMWGKVGFVRKKLYKKFVFTAICGFIPVLNTFFPESSFFVFLSYLQEQKQVGKIIEYFEKFAIGSAKKEE